MAQWKCPGLTTWMHGDVTAEVQLHPQAWHPLQWLLKAQADLRAQIPEETRFTTQNIRTQVECLKEAPDTLVIFLKKGQYRCHMHLYS